MEAKGEADVTTFCEQMVSEMAAVRKSNLDLGAKRVWDAAKDPVSRAWRRLYDSLALASVSNLLFDLTRDISKRSPIASCEQSKLLNLIHLYHLTKCQS